MLIEKKQLDFLRVFASCTDIKSVLSDKVQLQLKGNKLRFVQFSTLKLIYFLDVNNSNNEEFEMIVPTRKLYDLIKSFNSTFINFSANGIGSETGKNIYTFNQIQVSYPDVDLYIEKASKMDTKLEIQDIENAVLAKNYVGVEDLNVIAMNKQHYISSNRYVGAVLNSTNSDPSLFYIPTEVVNLLSSEGLKSIDIMKKEGEEFWKIEIKGILIFVPYQNYSLPDFFAEEFKSVFEYSNEIEFDKNEFRDILHRMSIVADSNPDNRLFFEYDGKKNLKISSIDYNISSEIIEVVERKGDFSKKIEIGLSCSYLLKVLESIKTDRVIFSFNYGSEDNPQKVVLFSDQKQENRLIVVIYYK